MKKLIALLLSLCTMLTVVGCSNKADTADNGAKDTLVVAQGADPTSLDPYGTTDSPAIRVAHCVFETLVTRDDEGNIAPMLAESWDIEDDCTYIFHLRKGVKFHNGEELKASDVAFSFSKIAESPHASSIRATIDFENSKALDDYTFEMKLTEPFGPILNHLSHAVMAIVNEKAYTEAGDQVNEKPCGTGPYKFVAWYPADRIEMVAFDDYWGEKAAITNLTWRTIPEIASRSIEVEAGTVDVAIDIQASELARLEKVEKVTTFKEERSSINFICLNNLIAPFDNVKVRQAINMAIDVDAICNVVYQGTGAVAQAPMSKSVWAYNDNLPPHERNVEKAKELLAEAGYPDGFTCTMTCDQNQQRLDTAEMVQMQLAEIGITMKIASMERGTFIDNVISGNLEMFGLGWTADTGDPDYALFASFHSSMHGEGGNMSFYTNPEVDRLLDLGRSSTDPEVRKDAYYKVQDLASSCSALRICTPTIPISRTSQPTLMAASSLLSCPGTDPHVYLPAGETPPAD